MGRCVRSTLDGAVSCPRAVNAQAAFTTKEQRQASMILKRRRLHNEIGVFMLDLFKGKMVSAIAEHWKVFARKV